MFMPYSHYRPKLGWGSLGGLGGLGGLGDFGAFDPSAAFTPPAGWTVQRGPVPITAENQLEFVSDYVTNCGLASLAARIPLPGSGGDTYAPPVGWYGVNLMQPAGSAGEEQYATDVVWINPSAGKAYQLGTCRISDVTNITTGEEDQPVAAGMSGMLVVAAVVGGGLLLRKLFGKKSSTKRINGAGRRGRLRRR